MNEKEGSDFSLATNNPSQEQRSDSRFSDTAVYGIRTPQSIAMSPTNPTITW